MSPCILYRNSYEFAYSDIFHEQNIAAKYFPVYNFRTEIPENSLVIGRYSTKPYYDELEKELLLKNSKLINSYKEHMYIADICNWYETIKEFTPKTYTQWGSLPEHGKWVVKGKTHSRKHQWKTHMFADGKENLLKVIRLLMDDLTISQDGLVVREYVSLAKLDTAINDLPIVKEWRMFFYKENYLTGGFYWSNYFDELKDKYPLEVPQAAIEYAKEVAKIVSQHTNFFVLDVSEKEDGSYIIIEINDGQQSGLSCVDPNNLYSGLKSLLQE